MLQGWSPGANCPVGTGPLGGAELFAAPALSCTTPRAGTRRPDFSAGEPPRADAAKRPPASPGALISVHHQPPNISCASQPPRQTTSSPSRKPTTASQPAFRRPLKENRRVAQQGLYSAFSSSVANAAFSSRLFLPASIGRVPLIPALTDLATCVCALTSCISPHAHKLPFQQAKNVHPRFALSTHSCGGRLPVCLGLE